MKEGVACKEVEGVMKKRKKKGFCSRRFSPPDHSSWGTMAEQTGGKIAIITDLADYSAVENMVIFTAGSNEHCARLHLNWQ